MINFTVSAIDPSTRPQPWPFPSCLGPATTGRMDVGQLLEEERSLLTCISPIIFGRLFFGAKHG